MARIRLVRRWFTKGLAWFRDPRIAFWKKGIALAAVAYLVSPVDFIPDFIPVLGWLDDLGVLAAATSWIAREIERHEDDAAMHDGLPRPLDDRHPPHSHASRVR